MNVNRRWYEMKNITGYDFTDDMNKMHDFMLLRMDEFISSYSY